MAFTTSLSAETVRGEFSIDVGLDQNLSNVIGLDNGGFASVYFVGAEDRPGLAIYDSPGDKTAIILDPKGPDANPMTGEPVLAQLSDGNILVAWTDEPNANINFSVINPNTGAFVVKNQGLTNFTGFTNPEVAAADNGRFVVAYDQGPGFGAAILRAGTQDITQNTVMFASESDTNDVSVAVLTGGRIVLAYVNDGVVKADIFSSSGTLVPGIGVLNVSTGSASTPQVTALPNGNFAVIYDDANIDGTPAIAMKIFSADGANVTPGGEQRVDTILVNDESDPEIAVLDSGVIVTSFTLNGKDVVGRMFDQDGFPSLSSFSIDTGTLVQKQSSIAGLTNGQFVTTWTEESVAGISARIHEPTRISKSDGAGDTIFFNDNLRDVMDGGGGNDTLIGGGGRDSLSGGDGVDELRVLGNDAVIGERYDGGADNDFLTVFTNAQPYDFRGSIIAGLEFLRISGNTPDATTLRFNADQFKFNQVFFDAVGKSSRTIEISMGKQDGIDLTNVKFGSNITPFDRVDIIGDDSAEAIVGSTIDDRIKGNGQNDQIDGGKGNDILEGGAGNDLLLGFDGDDLLKGGAGSDEIDGEGGSDFVDWSDATGAIEFAISPFEAVMVSAAGIGTDTVSNVENIRGGKGNDRLTGTIGQAVANEIDGGAGNDILNGGRGDDILIGDTGSDTIDLISATSAFTLTLDALGNGTVKADTIDTDTFFNIENVRGGFGGDTITGNDQDNTLDGGFGDDKLTGGKGNDTYIVDSAKDVVVEGSGAGNDTVTASVTYVLGAAAQIELLQLAPGLGSGEIDLTGNGFGQTIRGNTGDNVLKGGGGKDTLQGLTGNDTYFVDSADDLVIDSVNQGTGDTVIAGSTYALAAAAEIEVLQLAAGLGSGKIDLTGNSFSQTIRGNTGDNVLDGGGGTDTLQGLSGNDTYIVDSADDIILETAGNGTADVVETSVTYGLGADVEIEFVRTTSSVGTLPIDLTGNAFKQDITGNAGDNALNGGGEGAADTLRGLGGNDTYRIYNTADVIVETASQGTADIVNAAVDFTLGTGVHIETLRTNSGAAITTIDLTGNEITQSITGNAGANVLDGKGGDDKLSGLGGKDTLIGGAGKDSFVFSTAPSAANVDTIKDFNVADDTILLDQATFFSFTKLGAISSDSFRANTTGQAEDGSDLIIYQSTTGRLFYDADGQGGDAAVQFASVASGLGLTSADFTVI